VDVYGIIILYRTIAVSSSLKAGSVGEETRSYGFLDGDQVGLTDGGQGDFNALAELRELIADISRTCQ
jgi:hypothetical protein